MVTEVAQDVIIAGATWHDVPAVNVPKSGGGAAKFVDTTLPAAEAAAASDILAGKKSWVNGELVTGTGSGGGGGEYTIYPATTAPSAAQEGDIWLDYSQEITGLPDVITAGEQPVLMSAVHDVYIENADNMIATGVKIAISKAGTYRFKIFAFDGYLSTSSHGSVQLYKNGVAISGATATWTTHGGSYYATTGYGSVDVGCAAGDELELYAKAYSSSYGVVASLLIACIDWNIWGD